MTLPGIRSADHPSGDGISHRLGYSSRPADGFGSVLTGELGAASGQTASSNQTAGTTSTAATLTTVAAPASAAQPQPSAQSAIASAAAVAQSTLASAQASSSTAGTSGQRSTHHGQQQQNHTSGPGYVTLADGVTPAPVQPVDPKDPQATFAFFNGVRYYRMPQGSGQPVFIQADVLSQVSHQLAVNELAAASQVNFACNGGPGGISTPTAIPAFAAIENCMPTSLDAVPTVSQLVNLLTQNGYTQLQS